MGTRFKIKQTTEMSVFITISCAINNSETTETFAKDIAWSKLDSILAVSSTTGDSSDREAHKVYFLNNEVNKYKLKCALIH